jgi:carotenoid cleavage dioxygenase-like enzyme
VNRPDINAKTPHTYLQNEVLDMSAGNGTANTNLVYHAGKLMALHEVCGS